ncbi:Histone methylation DOT1 family protein (Precursor), related, related [Eimeria acervulina]|uniref:Histone methylation DOT1 family protein (Precursor), related, related n=1 Tax=Eimeria acervulina TaxID=5801 RepID=U6GBI0_EIMAC|nr:Histone methylation DOT1 family protein (Precursor), related, related [Eimeria acervulina]CDI76897.1 Histone methylation DOT1 family protein (Precursor), related, related [Eimeria acervulina]
MASSPIKYTDGTTPCEGAAAPEVLSYSEDEEDEWMPFRRSAPDSAKAEDGWNLGGFVSPFQCVFRHCTPEDIMMVLYSSLGCGDGRFIIECCRLTNCAGVGVELDSSLFERAKRNAKRIPDINAKFLQRDLMAPDLDLSEATVMWVSSP